MIPRPPSNRTSLCLLAMLFLGASVAHAEPKLSAQMQRSSISVGDTTVVVIHVTETDSPTQPTLEIKKGDASGIRANFLGNSSQTTITNGKIEQFFSFQFRVTGLKEGEYTLSGTNTQGGKTFTTEELKLTVRPQTDAEKKLAPQLELAVGKTEIYLGEMLPVRIIFSTSPNTDPEFHNGTPAVESNGFVMQPLDGIIRGRPDENGRPRHYFEGACEALRSGDLTLGPATYPLTVLFRNRVNRLATRRQYNLASESVTIKVKPLPSEGKPESFNGAVGRFDFAAQAAPLRVIQGEPVSVTLTISGTGNLPSIKAPTLTENIDAWKLYPPNRVDSRDKNRRRRDPMAPVSNSGRVTFTQVVVPLETGNLLPPFEFSYFDPDTQTYRTLRSDPIKLEVGPNPNATSTATTAAAPDPAPTQPAEPAPEPPKKSPPPIEQMTDILSIRDLDDQPWAGAKKPLLQSKLFWAMQAPPAAALLGLLAFAFSRRLGERQRDTGWDGVYPPCAEILRKLEAKPDVAKPFYQHAHQFLAAWEEQSTAGALASLDEEQTAAVKKIRERHSLLTFGSSADAAGQSISADEQREVIQILKSLPQHA